MKRTLLLAFILVLGSVGYALAQSRVTGKISDRETGSPVPFASVVVKETGVGVAADGAGNFSIQAPANAILVFSSIGYDELEEKVGNRSVVNVSLNPSAQSLDEIVVMGYTTIRRRSLVGSTSIVDAAKIQNKPIITIDQALQGNVPGLISSTSSGQPGADSRVVIRGLGSINAGTDPLYVVDGVPLTIGNWSSSAAQGWSSPSTVLSNLNPNDIESVNVLKDASATSIYGSRAANGVILITTKKGKMGKPVFNLNAQTGLSSRARKFEMLNAAEYIELTTESLRNSGYSDAQIAAEFDKFPKQANGDFNDTNWVDDYAFRSNAKTYSADLSVSGGTETTSYYASISEFNQDAILKWGGLSRKSVRLNLTQQGGWINFGVNAAYSFTKQDSPLTTAAYYINPIAGSLNLSPLETPFNLDGTYRTRLIGNNGTNYVQANDLNTSKSGADRLLGNMFAEIVFLKDFRFKSTWGIDHTGLAEDEYDDPRANGSSADNIGRATKTHRKMRRWNTTNTLTYNKTIGDGHNVNALIGQEAENFDYDNLQAQSENFGSYKMRQVSSGATPVSTLGSRSAYRLAAYLAQANYDYQSKYFFSASYRYDGSSKFGTDNKWASFWSVGGAWDASKEAFMSNIPVINQLKLRTSYGTSGNSDIGNYRSQGLYGYTAYNGASASYPYQLANPDLTWEQQGLFNIGIDFQLLERRLGGTFEYYNRRTSRLLLDVPFSALVGFQSQLRNVGKVENQGLEITLYGEPVRVKNFYWKVEANWSTNKNKVLALSGIENEFITPIGVGGNTRKRIRVGEDINQFWLVRYAGVNPADGAQMWYDRDGELVFTRNYNDMATNGIGSASPKWQGGLTNTLSAYGLDLSFFFYYQYGNKIFDNAAYGYQHDGSSANKNEARSQLDRWQKPGDITKNPKRSTGQTTQVSTRFLYDGSFIRLRNVSLGYNLPKSIVEKVKLTNARVFVQGMNLLTITKYPGQDPEFAIDGENFYQYPIARTWMVGLDIKF